MLLVGGLVEITGSEAPSALSRVCPASRWLIPNPEYYLMPVTAVTNGLLEKLPHDVCTELLSRCEKIDLVFGETLIESGQGYRHVYFPLRGFISKISVMNGRAALETGLVGLEGMLGATLALGVGSAPTRAMVQGAGTALRMEEGVFTELLATHPELRWVVMHYLHVMIEQLAQTSACTRYHVVESRLARWLMMTGDRAGSDSFFITQEFIATMLGVRRVGVTHAAGELQRLGLIHYSRGKLRILDRRGLLAASCSCYDADCEVYARTMSL